MDAVPTRRPKSQVVSNLKRPVEVRLVSLEPFELEIDGAKVVNLDIPSGMSVDRLKRTLAKPVPCTVVTDSIGNTYYLFGEVGGYKANWYIAKRPFGHTSVFEPWIPLTSRPPSRKEEIFRLSLISAPKLVVGDVMSWSYSLQDSCLNCAGWGRGMLSADGYTFPLERPESRTKEIELWPEYVQRLRKIYKTDDTWRNLISLLRGKFPEDLFPKDLPVHRAVQQEVERTNLIRVGGVQEPRAGNIYCFDGKIRGLDLAGIKSTTVEAGVHWGETNHLAWIFRVNGEVSVIVVDKQSPDAAAWVFLDPDSVAQLVNPSFNPGEHWRARYSRIREHAVYYCPHLEGWEERLNMLVLALLNRSGCTEAGAAFESRAKAGGEKRRAALHVRRILKEFDKAELEEATV